MEGNASFKSLEMRSLIYNSNHLDHLVFQRASYLCFEIDDVCKGIVDAISEVVGFLLHQTIGIRKGEQETSSNQQLEQLLKV